MQVRDIMTSGVEGVSGDATVLSAAQKMEALNVGALPVLDGDRVAGIITDRDIAVRGVAHSVNMTQMHVRDIMTPGAEHVTEDQDVQEAAHLMEVKQIRRVLVTSPEGGVIGILSLGDIAVHMHDATLGGEVLERVSEPARPHR